MPIEKLRAKAMVLLWIDLAARASDIVSIPRSSVEFSKSGMHLMIYWPKEESNGSPMLKPAYVARIEHDPLICSNEAVRAWLVRSAALYNDHIQRDMVMEGVASSKLPGKDIGLFSSLHKRKGKYFSITSQRAYHVIMDMVFNPLHLQSWTPHDIRGATASKLRNAGLPMDEVLQAARWKSERTFTKVYFKDIRSMSKSCCSLPLP